MPDFIKDGTGGGYLAGVDSSNRSQVSARSNPRICYASRDNSKAYTVQLHCTQAEGGTSEGIGYIKNTGSKNILIKEIAFSTEEPNGGLSKFGVIRQPTVSDGTDRDPVNLNFGSNNTPGATIKEATNSGTVTVAGDKSLYTIRMNGMGTYVLDLHDAVILTINSILGIRTNPDTTSTKTIVNIMFTEED